MGNYLGVEAVDWGTMASTQSTVVIDHVTVVPENLEESTGADRVEGSDRSPRTE